MSAAIAPLSGSATLSAVSAVAARKLRRFIGVLLSKLDEFVPARRRDSYRPPPTVMRRERYSMMTAGDARLLRRSRQMHSEGRAAPGLRIDRQVAAVPI